MKSPSAPETDVLRGLTDQCVMCGMCLPACPTYIKTLNEAESPRGRISLMQAILTNKLEPSPRALEHLDNCLVCRACELVCPSGVAYGRLIDGMRAQQRNNGQATSRVQRALLDATQTPGRLRLGAKLLRVSRGAGFGLMVQWLGGKHSRNLNGWAKLLASTDAHQAWRPYYPATANKVGEVALFTGCIADIIDQVTLRDAVTLLNHCGYGVHVPAAQGCCGAMHQHAGDTEQASRLAAANLEAFSIDGISAVICLATGCATQLRDYARTCPEHPQAAQFSVQMHDIHAFLLGHDALKRCQFRPLATHVAVHEPCTLRNVLRQADLPYQMLRMIPDIRLTSLADNARCCGAAGSYMLDHPEMADSLLDDKLASIDAAHPDILVSANVGCALHIAAGLRQGGQSIEVLHPVSLMVRQLVV